MNCGTIPMKLDKFYTIPSVSKKCLSSIELFYLDKTQPKYNWNDFYVIEPSAGNASFYNQIPTDKKIGIDISPEHDNIIKQDFFTYNPPINLNCKIMVVGNPPFGRVSSLAVRFFNYASKWADVIAFILPRTFRRVSIKNKLNSNFHLIHDEDIPTIPCSFSPKMMAKCCFQIWEKRTTIRPKIELPKRHDDFTFTNQTSADFAIRAYGGKCGQIKTDNLTDPKLCSKSWHWIKANIDKDILIDRFKQLDYSLSHDTARQNSIGRGELIKLYINKY